MAAAFDRILGLDVGSATVGWAITDAQGNLLESGCESHHGRVYPLINRVLQSLTPNTSLGVGWNGGWLASPDGAVADAVALMTAVRHRYGDGAVPAVLHIGAERFVLYLFRDDGRYWKSITNSGCAAGTGSFLDQQAERLNLNSSMRLAELAAGHNGQVPDIATRCAVFAKTDLIHAQQKGFSLAAICAGLCRGVARNILENVTRGIQLPERILVTGGVANNRKVIEYLQEFSDRKVEAAAAPEILPALGVALIAAREGRAVPVKRFLRLLKAEFKKKKEYAYRPLKRLPYRIAGDRPVKQFTSNGVEVELFARPPVGKTVPVYLGIDIGSTSTKAVVMNPGKQVLMGLYTRTRGQPVTAVQRLLATLKEVQWESGFELNYLATGTTGSGRKFIRKIVRADLAVDEITAHARAAVHLEPRVDTIIEIGGQDSKFTVVRNGRVVFSVMNFVCAAGTGSFLEEQATRLGVSLADYSELAERVRAPMTSDRCTVFMERDLNHLLSLGYNSHELLAAALHSVRDNYLTKVARQDKIGDFITFQGATAKNAALVKAFEQKLGKPIFVSPYCHLTGALGVCLILQEQQIQGNGAFQYDLDEKTIQVTEQVCPDCTNHCKIVQVDLAGETVEWGFLCGKDDFSQKKVSRSGNGMNWLQERDRVLLTGKADWVPGDAGLTVRQYNLWNGLQEAAAAVKRFRRRLKRTERSAKEDRTPRTIGIPRTLYLSEFFPLWREVFRELGFRVRTLPGSVDTLREGKQLAGAEFCAPIVNFHGVVQKLLQTADYVFLPTIFGHTIAGKTKAFCYYSNYSVALLQNNARLTGGDRLIAPVLQLEQGEEALAEDLYEALPRDLRRLTTVEQIEEAVQKAMKRIDQRQRLLRASYEPFSRQIRHFGVVLLGRPYLVLDPLFNLQLAERISERDIPVIYQDQLPLPDEEFRDGPVFSHWYYGEQILQATKFVVEHPNLYPIYLTAFKCAPDSFLLNYFRDYLDRHDKPYLILQLDEHNSQEGYETRIEAALETFRNHQQKQAVTKQSRKVPFTSEFENKTYLLPNYEPLATELIGAAFRRYGVEALPIRETPETIRQALRLNDGQCLPISALAQGIAHSVDYYGLKPEKTVFFINAISELSCNLPQYPVLIGNLLAKMGGGLEKITIFLSSTTMLELPFQMVVDIYCAYLLGGLLQKLACRVRPRESQPGKTDELIARATRLLAEAIATGKPREKIFRDLVSELLQISGRPLTEPMPRVGIVGDLYVRDNHVFNQELIRFVEQHGAEAVTTPYNFLVRLVAAKHFSELKIEKRYLPLVLEKYLLTALKFFDEKYLALARPVLQEKYPYFRESFLRRLEDFNLSVLHAGETSQNLMKIYYLLDHYPDIRLLVHVNPVFCCPGLVSEALFQRVEEETGVPIVSITYDGTRTDQNKVLLPYLHFLNEEKPALLHSESGLE